MKVGVLTFHRCINYGSYWQARCLVEGLRGRGIDAVLLDHRSARVRRAEWRCALDPLCPAPPGAGDRAAYARKVRRFLAAFEALPLSAPFCLERPDAVEEQDLVLVGSDEVWNLRHPWYGRQRLFYGAGLPARRLAAYAASFGNHGAADGLEDGFGAMLRRFEAISVRDHNSRWIVRAALGREVDLVLDPCLQFPDVATRPTAASDYVLVYGHGFPDWFVAAVAAWSRDRGLRLVSLGYRADWADEQWLDAGPEDFPAAVAGAAAVATTFFHGCVLALLQRRPFVCAANDYRANKVRSLVALVGAEAHLASEDTPAAGYRAVLDRAPDPAIDRRIAALRARSGAFLDHVLA